MIVLSIVREQSDVTYEHLRSAVNLADILTKPLGAGQYKNFADRLRGRVEWQSIINDTLRYGDQRHELFTIECSVCV